MRAVTQLLSWSKVIGLDLNPIGPYSFEVPQGKVQVVDGVLVAESPTSKAKVQLEDFMNRDVSVSVKAFNDVTEVLGLGRPNPLANRTPSKKRLKYTDEPEMIALRHMEVRRVPNASPEELKLYDRVVRAAVKYNYYKFYTYFQKAQLGRDDLYSYALMWTNNFLGAMKVPDHLARKDENCKLLCAHLKQRFVDLRNVQARKNRSVVISRDVFELALGNNTTMPLEYQQAAEDDDVIPLKKEITLRHQKSSLELEARLKAMPHDEMIETLTRVGSSEDLHPDAAAEARKRLNFHRRWCSKKECQKSMAG